MPKSKNLCAHCDAKLTSGRSFCPNCKQPTMFASVEERTAWELEQWTQKRGAARKKSVARPAETVVAKPKRAPKPVSVPPKKAPAATSVLRVPAKAAVRPKPESSKVDPIKPSAPQAEASRPQPAKRLAAKPERPKDERPAKPLVIDLRRADEPRDLELEQIELLRELLVRVSAIEERRNGGRIRRLRLLKR